MPARPHLSQLYNGKTIKNLIFEDINRVNGEFGSFNFAATKATSKTTRKKRIFPFVRQRLGLALLAGLTGGRNGRAAIIPSLRLIQRKCYIFPRWSAKMSKWADVEEREDT